MQKQKKQAGFTFRTDAEKLKIFSALCTLNDTSPTNVLRDMVDAYVEKYKNMINQEAIRK